MILVASVRMEMSFSRGEYVKAGWFSMFETPNLSAAMLSSTLCSPTITCIDDGYLTEEMNRLYVQWAAVRT